MSYNCFLRKYHKYDLPMAQYGKIDFDKILKTWELKVNEKSLKYFKELKNILTAEEPKFLAFNFIADLEYYEKLNKVAYSKANPHVLKDIGLDINHYVDNISVKVEKKIRKNKEYRPVLNHNMKMKEGSKKQKIRDYNQNESHLKYGEKNNNNIGNSNDNSENNMKSNSDINSYFDSNIQNQNPFSNPIPNDPNYKILSGIKSTNNPYYEPQEPIGQRAIGSSIEPITQGNMGSFQGNTNIRSIGSFQGPIDQRANYPGDVNNYAYPHSGNGFHGKPKNNTYGSSF